MKKLPDFVKWLIIAAVLAGMAALMVAVNVGSNFYLYLSKLWSN